MLIVTFNSWWLISLDLLFGYIIEHGSTRATSGSSKFLAKLDDIILYVFLKSTIIVHGLEEFKYLLTLTIFGFFSIHHNSINLI